MDVGRLGFMLISLQILFLEAIKLRYLRVETCFAKVGCSQRHSHGWGFQVGTLISFVMQPNHIPARNSFMLDLELKGCVDRTVDQSKH